MPARHMPFLPDLRSPALLGTASSSTLYGNASGEGLIAEGANRRRCLALIDEVVATGDARTALVGDVELTFAPLFDERHRVEAVIAAVTPLAALPRLLDRMQGPMRDFARIVSLLPHAIATARPSGEIDYLSRRWYVITGQTPWERSPREAFAAALVEPQHDTDLKRWHDGIQSGKVFSFELQLATREGPRWFELHAAPVRDKRRILKWAAAISDVDAQVRARDSLRHSEARQRFIAEAARFMGASSDLGALARGIAELGAREGGTWILEIGEPGKRVSVVRPDQSTLPLATLRLVAETGEATCRAFEGGEAALVVQIQGRDRYGFIALTSLEPPDRLGQRLPLLQDLATILAAAINRILTSERERIIAETLQRAMLPVALPYASNVRFDVAYTPASPQTLVGGDWYDAFELEDGRLGIAIGDVAGHGLDAAITMGQVRQIMRAASREDSDPATVLARVNHVLCSEGSAIASAFFGVLDPLALTLAYGSAGHPPPVLVEADGSVRPLPTGGRILGAVDTTPTRTQISELPAGGALVLYTDGVLESERDAVKGEARLHEVLEAWARGGFRGRASDLQAAAVSGKRAHDDDAAMFVVRFLTSDDFDVSLRAAGDNVRRLRLAVARYVAQSAVEPEREHDVTLAITEAIDHAVTSVDGPQTLRVVLHRDAEGIDAAISHDGSRDDSKPEAQLPLNAARQLGSGSHVSDVRFAHHVNLHIDTRVPSLGQAEPSR